MRQSAAHVTPLNAPRRRTGLSPARALRAAALVVVAAALAACASNAPRSGASAPASSGAQTAQTTPSAPTVDPNAPVVVALLAPVSASSKGVRQAAQDLVAAAQLANRDRAPANMTLKVYDSRGDAAGAAEAASHAVRDGAALIVGPLLSGSTKAASPVAAEAGLNILSFSNDVSAAGGNVWILGQRPGDELRRLLSYASSQGVGAVGVAYPTSRYGELIASEASPAGRDVGVSVGPFVAYERSFQGIERASRDGASALRADGVDGVVIADRGDALRSMAAFLAYYDLSPRNVRFMGLSRWADPGNTKETALNGGWYVAADPDAKAAFDGRFAQRASRTPHRVAHIGYDAVAVAAALLSAAKGSGDTAPFSAAAINSLGAVNGAHGGFTLTRDGANRRGLAIMQVASDGLQVLDPAPRIASGS